MVNYEMRGSMCSSLVPYVLLLVLLLSLCANEAALGQSNQDTRLGAHGDAEDVTRWEHWTGRSLLIDRGAFLSNSLETDDPLSGNSTTDAHYKSNVELEAALRNFTQRCSHISRLYSIGNSTLGVPLWVLEISDKPGITEPEPAFKYVGNMHGDEPLGRELVLYLADWLCDNYLEDSLATLIVNKVHLHLLASMNPDGFAAKPTPTRNNAHDVDLNRDFPDQFFPQNNVEEKRQAETRAVMGWIRSIRFTGSASFHEGALVANYPYDGTHDPSSTKYSISPDDSTFKYLASLYAKNHPVMVNSKEFAGGVTNGAAWYPLYGGMQDWNYLHGDCLELTLEMNEDKWPPPSKVLSNTQLTESGMDRIEGFDVGSLAVTPFQVAKIWDEHRKSMLELVAAMALSGVHGRIISSPTGKPLAATIDVSGISHKITASAKFGDYHRLLAPGEVYEVTASMVGYDSRTTSIYMPDEGAVMLDFILDPLPTDAENLSRARLRGQGQSGKNGTTRKIPPAPQQRASGTAADKAPPVTEERQPMEMVSWKPSKFNRKGFRSQALMHDEPGYALTTQFQLPYLLLLVAVTFALGCLLFRARGGHRYQTWRQRVSRE